MSNYTESGWIDSAEYLGVTPDEMQQRGFKLIGRGKTTVPLDRIVYSWTGKKYAVKRNNNIKYYIGRWCKKE